MTESINMNVRTNSIKIPSVMLTPCVSAGDLNGKHYKDFLGTWNSAKMLQIKIQEAVKLIGSALFLEP